MNFVTLGDWAREPGDEILLLYIIYRKTYIIAISNLTLIVSFLGSYKIRKVKHEYSFSV